MINFAVGPVQSDDYVLNIGALQVPYFRTPEFSTVMLENERLILGFANAPEESRAVFLTGSGTAAMESVVMNVLNDRDKAIVVNGGSFGNRFHQLCEIHNVSHDCIMVQRGKGLTLEDLSPFEGDASYSAFIVNLHETSTGVLYDIDLISRFCERNNLLLIVDAISSFLADELDMKRAGIDVVIVGSQKALACPPGVSVVMLSTRALQRINGNSSKCMYLDLKNALEDGLRGQTPFTPAVGTLLQINARLRYIEKHGGVDTEIVKTRRIAEDFRGKIAHLPFEIASESLSNAVTPLKTLTAEADTVVNTLKNEYGIWVCPNGGELAKLQFRVGHIGALTVEDNDALVSALRGMQSRGII